MSFFRIQVGSMCYWRNNSLQGLQLIATFSHVTYIIFKCCFTYSSNKIRSFISRK